VLLEAKAVCIELPCQERHGVSHGCERCSNSRPEAGRTNGWKLHGVDVLCSCSNGCALQFRSQDRLRLRLLSAVTQGGPPVVAEALLQIA
jgi:hypothetical protein